MFDNTLEGVNIIYIIPTILATDYFGSALTSTYADSDSGLFKLTVIYVSCMSTAFI
jgi:hypothetical protein